MDRGRWEDERAFYHFHPRDDISSTTVKYDFPLHVCVRSLGAFESDGVQMAVKIDVDTCIGCGACVEACPVQALSMVKDKSKVDADTCVECGACVGVCPVGALSL
jgi:ferredoxin